ncbi:hypothetical protein GQ53DRAFT_289600 [Thozetella sp. PMI_491]|nr:hypothetical protein GQ53DRAFT_289600 [Thozetella sp. PMI_491]
MVGLDRADPDGLGTSRSIQTEADRDARGRARPPQHDSLSADRRLMRSVRSDAGRALEHITPVGNPGRSSQNTHWQGNAFWRLSPLYSVVAVLKAEPHGGEAQYPVSLRSPAHQLGTAFASWAIIAADSIAGMYAFAESICAKARGPGCRAPRKGGSLRRRKCCRRRGPCFCHAPRWRYSRLHGAMKSMSQSQARQRVVASAALLHRGWPSVSSSPAACAVEECCSPCHWPMGGRCAIQTPLTLPLPTSNSGQSVFGCSARD